MINKCLYWQLTMTCYDDILCAMLKTPWTTLWCTEHFGSASLHKATENTFPAGDGPFTLLSSDSGRGVSFGSPDSSVCPCSAPGAGKRSTETHRSDVAPSNELILLPRGGGNESTRTCTDSRAYRGLHQFPANLFVLYCTHQVPVSHPHPLFLYSDGETLLVYVFDICTNAPVWKRKWNLDISVIIGLLVFLFTANNHLKNADKIVIWLIMGGLETLCETAPSGAQWWVTAVVAKNQGMNKI